MVLPTPMMPERETLKKEGSTTIQYLDPGLSTLVSSRRLVECSLCHALLLVHVFGPARGSINGGQCGGQTFRG